MKIVTMLNQKGGVGKTSTTFHLSATLAEMGHRVLLVDNDPQSSLTQGFFGPSATFAADPNETIEAIHGGRLPFPARVIRPTGIAGVAIVPGSERTARWNRPEPGDAPVPQQRALADFLEEVEGDHDLALIDCSPTLSLCSWAALVASDAVVVPMQPEDFGAQGLAAIRRAIGEVRASQNPRLRLAGYLLTMVKKITVHRSYEDVLRSQYGEGVFAATVPEMTAFKEAVSARLPIAAVRPKKPAPARAIRDVAEELVRRVAEPEVRRAEVA